MLSVKELLVRLTQEQGANAMQNLLSGLSAVRINGEMDLMEKGPNIEGIEGVIGPYIEGVLYYDPPRELSSLPRDLENMSEATGFPFFLRMYDDGRRFGSYQAFLDLSYFNGKWGLLISTNKKTEEQSPKVSIYREL